MSFRIEPYKAAILCHGLYSQTAADLRWVDQKETGFSTSQPAMAAVACYVVSLVLILIAAADGQLNPTFYDKSCPKALTTVKAVVNRAVAKEKRMGASLLRLHFHDCFVNGCDGSVLLDDSSTITGEKTAAPNANSARGFDVVDDIKAQVEAACPGVVSCADILAIAARDSVVALGGPSWRVLLGRRDSTTASKAAANNDIPSPFSGFGSLVSNFQAHGLSTKDLIALSGAHTIGEARCAVFKSRIYNDSNIDAAYANSLKAKCPINGGVNNLFPLDLVTPTRFDNSYYKNLQKQRGLLHSDQAISTNSRVNAYAGNPRAFAIDFAAAMVKMGNFRPLTGRNGEIRRNCRKPN